MTVSKDRKVLNLGDYDQLRKPAGYGAGVEVLEECRSLAVQRLEQHLARMMEKVDDALFARAEKSESNTVQTRYFDAMREMRIIRKDIEDDFSRAFNTSFEEGIPRKYALDESLALDWESESGEGVGLVGKDELEEDLAISNMVNKLRGTCTQSLYALDKRMGLLIRDPELERWHNPVGPEAICNAFRTAAQRIETGLEIRLVVFKLFDQHVVDKIDLLYREINQHLVSRGVMPEIKATARKNPRGYRPPATRDPAGSAAQPDPAGESGYHTPAAPGGDYAGYGTPAGISGYALAQGIHALTWLQHGSLPENGGEGLDTGALDPDSLVAGNVNVLHGVKAAGITRDLGKAGDMAIDIVAMLFDFVLDDRNVADSLRAQIGRLQIPVLKVALLDRSFFARKTHPARQLMNRLSVAAIGWSEERGTDDPLFRKIEQVVQTILDEFDDDVCIFERLLKDFEQFLSREEQQAEQTENRSARLAEGRERLQVARSNTLEEITPRVDDRRNVEFVRRFLGSHWKNLLFVICSRDGKDSEQWKQAVATMDELIWSIKPKQTPEERQKLIQIQPRLLQQLREGMQRLSLPAAECDEFIAMLVRAHGRTGATEINDDTAKGTVPQLADYQEFSGAVIEETASEENLSVDEINEETEGRQYPEIDDEHAEAARALKQGAWIEFRGKDAGNSRAKLSWISPITKTCLFTDRMGRKAANLSVAEIAHFLRYSRIRVLNTKPLLDRAVTTALQNYMKH